MAGIDVGSSGGKRRATNSDINMIPFIDLLMVTVSFLLITAVWASSSRIKTDAQVPSNTGCGENCGDQQAMLHVMVGENDFDLVWRQHGTVISDVKIPRDAFEVSVASQKLLKFPTLASSIEKEWRDRGVHRDPSDRGVDNAVLHTDNKTTFREIVAVLDAINATRRTMKMPDGSVLNVAAFNPTFAALDK